MSPSAFRVGLDAGGVSVKVVALDPEDRVVRRVARRHHGNPVAVAAETLRELDIPGTVAVGITGSYGGLIAGGLNLVPVDVVSAEIESVRRRFPKARNIINVGGSSVTLIQLDESGRFLDYSTNSLCAAGTGSFLDQQAERLGIRYEDMAAFPHHDAPPPIATRCSVFAKTDLIHRQQEGYDKAALWSGLCKSMTGTFLNTLLRGRPLKGLTVLTGGVSQNREVLRWLTARYGEMVQTFDDAAYSCAIGAAHMTNGHADGLAATVGSLHDKGQRAAEAPRRSRLEFHKTHYPSFAVAEAYTDELGNEVRITHWPEGAPVAAYLGIDVGSTSTKAVLMDAQERVLADVYRRTAGDPIQATKNLFIAIQQLAERKRSPVQVLGVGTTGSGRKLVGQVIGADEVTNEITAHLTGAMHVDPTVDTIFEIGGQDSKYIRARNGRISDSNMNYVCAAGTGSFVEEQAKKLGLGLEEIGRVVMGIAPPVTSDRCTVFMEQDVERLLRQGYTREECMAAVLCSVVKNYLNKVVGRRRVSNSKIFFQGATARNPGLVAAFENLLGVEMVVSPYCHVMGSYGAALLTKRALTARRAASRFKGLDLSQRKITLSNERCELCQNRCNISFAQIEGEPERPSWGYMCGRDPEEKSVRVREEFQPFRKRMSLLLKEEGAVPATATRTVGMPRALTAFSHYPLWRTFFRELGFKLALSERTSEEIVRRGGEVTAADFCFPIKVAHGHAATLAADPAVDFIFLPQMICASTNPATTNSHYCPYVQAFPSVVRSALTVHGVDASRLLSPVVDFSLRATQQSGELVDTMAERLEVSPSAVRAAWRKAKEAQAHFDHARKAEGERLLQRLERANATAIVVMGRPYSTLDAGANLSLPQKIADLGLTVIPMDMLPTDTERINPAFRNMYWAYGQEVLCAAEFIRRHKNLVGVYFTNFSCGPDSFLLSFVEEIMAEKPFLTLELDEHGGDAGYLTRIQAFMDVVRATPPAAFGTFHVPNTRTELKEIRRRKLWLPNMHPLGGPLFASSLRAAGFDAESLPPETRESFDMGRSLTRGSECMPTACTTGVFADLMRRKNLDARGQALFMPTSDGPCRFGQYATLQRLVFNRMGWGQVQILSPCAGNSYLGLPQATRIALWRAMLCADMLWKAGCRIRPYETEPGATDRAVRREAEGIAALMEQKRDVRSAFRAAIRRIGEVPAERIGSKPLVGVVGEIYVRCNLFSNDEVIRAIERYGGEAWLAPMGEWILYSAAFQQWHTLRQPMRLHETLGAFLRNKFLTDMEHEFHSLASPLLADRREPPIQEVIDEGARYLPMNFGGEAIITMGRARLFAQRGAALVVNVAPFGCMPGTITSALCRQVQSETRVPMVSLFYDGEPGMNQRLEAFLAGLARR